MEEKEMAVLARPLNMSFEIDSSKTKQFFDSVDKSAYNKAMARAKKHGYNPENQKGRTNIK